MRSHRASDTCGVRRLREKGEMLVYAAATASFPALVCGACFRGGASTEQTALHARRPLNAAPTLRVVTPERVIARVGR